MLHWLINCSRYALYGIIVCLGFFMYTGALCLQYSIYFNVSNSLPYGFYLALSYKPSQAYKQASALPLKAQDKLEENKSSYMPSTPSSNFEEHTLDNTARTTSDNKVSTTLSNTAPYLRSKMNLDWCPSLGFYTGVSPIMRPEHNLNIRAVLMNKDSTSPASSNTLDRHLKSTIKAVPDLDNNSNDQTKPIQNNKLAENAKHTGNSGHNESREHKIHAKNTGNIENPESLENLGDIKLLRNMGHTRNIGNTRNSDEVKQANLVNQSLSNDLYDLQKLSNPVLSSNLPQAKSSQWVKYDGAHSYIFNSELVLICLSPQWAEWATQRQYVGYGKCPGASAPLGKWIVARAGDVVKFSARGIYVNNKLIPLSKPAKTDGSGRAMPRFISQAIRLRHQQIVVCNSKIDSFDSRYYGPIDERQIQARLIPLWTWQ